MKKVIRIFQTKPVQQLVYITSIIIVLALLSSFGCLR